VTLAELLERMDIAAVRGPTDVAVEGVSYDSRRVRARDVFFGLHGAHADGARFARAAFEAGASAAVVGRGVALEGGTVVEVEEPRKALAQAALAVYGDPGRSLKVAGVTGTNGKTTTTYLLESIFRAAGITAGVIGTTGVRIAGETRPATLTTPASAAKSNDTEVMRRSCARNRSASSCMVLTRTTW
jgi:UDP-N-acetylmuramoyl-L-alanyl-D-glutamate--2,6-diaminopimelate ligase